MTSITKTTVSALSLHGILYWNLEPTLSIVLSMEHWLDDSISELTDREKVCSSLLVALRNQLEDAINKTNSLLKDID